ncbi:MAG: glycosyltransferase [Lachnospiraceae bacterium]|nr:glycosyltransferase [Lachnospiraceae bacterium]
MGKLTIANLKKTLYYLRRNGLRNTLNAARERLSSAEHYEPRILSEEELLAMRKEVASWLSDADAAGKSLPLFSILVPAYRTNPVFLKELVESVGAQVYPKWELLILDASGAESLQDILRDICDETRLRFQVASDGARDHAEGHRIKKEDGNAQNLECSDNTQVTEEDGNAQSHEEAGVVRYVRLSDNAGISENTNAGLPYVRGEYVGLLDHDDVLTPDALYEMARAICHVGTGHGALETQGPALEDAPLVVYSDEDKWDGGTHYYELNRKEVFNLDLLLSNNYICHFLVMQTELFRTLRLRKEFDGAQDYDLVLRAAGKMLQEGEMPEDEICYVPKVLYHWRCHEGSTAENPRSKLYAYDAGRRALQDFSDAQGWHAKAEDLKHLGFYRLRFQGMDTLLKDRSDLGAVGGKILSGDKVVGGRMAEDGSVYYEGLSEGFSGYLNRGVLTQDAVAVDIRCICVPEECRSFFEQIAGVPYATKVLPSGQEIFDAGTLPEGADVKKISLAFCTLMRDAGKRILWDPEMVLRLK